MLTAAVHVPLCDSVGLMAISYARVNADNAMATKTITSHRFKRPCDGVIYQAVPFFGTITVVKARY